MNKTEEVRNAMAWFAVDEPQNRIEIQADATHWAQGSWDNGCILADELRHLRADNAHLRAAMTEVIESMTATQYCLEVVRPDMEKIEGPDWLEVFNGMRNEYNNLQDALAYSNSAARPAKTARGKR